MKLKPPVAYPQSSPQCFHFLRPQASHGTATDFFLSYNSCTSRIIYPDDSQDELSSPQSQFQSQSQSPSSTIESLLLDRTAGDGLNLSHQYPTDGIHVVHGVPFKVNFRRL